MKKETKKVIYLILWYVAGVEIINFIILLFRWIYENETKVFKLNTSWEVIFTLGTLAGLFIGYILGPIAWHKIYVEGVRGKKYIEK